MFVNHYKLSQVAALLFIRVLTPAAKSTDMHADTRTITEISTNTDEPTAMTIPPENTDFQTTSYLLPDRIASYRLPQRLVSCLLLHRLESPPVTLYSKSSLVLAASSGVDSRTILSHANVPCIDPMRCDFRRDARCHDSIRRHVF